MPQFLVAPGRIATGRAFLDGEEARHARDVCRVKTGDAIRLFDGAGTGYEGNVLAVSKREIEVKILSTFHTPSGRVPGLVLAPAVLPSDAMAEVIVRATEIGAAEVLPVLSERCQVRMGADRRSGKETRWRELALAASKQSERLRLPVIHPVVSFPALSETFGRYNLVLIGHPGLSSQAAGKILEETGKDFLGKILLLIGPEGGFTEAEVETAVRAGAKPITSGPALLRSQTASIYFLSVLADFFTRCKY